MFLNQGLQEHDVDVKTLKTCMWVYLWKQTLQVPWWLSSRLNNSTKGMFIKYLYLPGNGEQQTCWVSTTIQRQWRTILLFLRQKKPIIPYDACNVPGGCKTSPLGVGEIPRYATESKCSQISEEKSQKWIRLLYQVTILEEAPLCKQEQR